MEAAGIVEEPSDEEEAAEREEAAEDAQASDEETGPADQNAQP
jgi:hypothetical protein